MPGECCQNDGAHSHSGADGLGEAPSTTSSPVSSVREDVSTVPSASEADLDQPTVAEQMENIGVGSFHRWCIFSCCSLFCTLGTELALHETFVTSVSREWDLVRSKFSISTAICFAVGCAVGGILGDRQGRQPMLLASSLLYIVSTSLSAIAPDVSALFVFRSLANIFLGCEVPVALTLLIELMPNRWRSWSGIVVLGAGLFAGCMWTGLGLGVYLICDLPLRYLWRCLLLLCLAPQLLGLSVFWSNIPESPRWLVTKGRTRMCFAVLTSIAEQNGEDTIMHGENGVRGGEIFNFDDRIINAVRSSAFLQPFLACFACLVISISCSLTTLENMQFSEPSSGDQLLARSGFDWFWLLSIQSPAIAGALAAIDSVGHRWTTEGSFIMAFAFSSSLLLPWPGNAAICLQLAQLCALSAGGILSVISLLESIATVCRCSGLGLVLLLSFFSVGMVLDIFVNLPLSWKGVAQALLCVFGLVITHWHVKETRWSDLINNPDDCNECCSTPPQHLPKPLSTPLLVSH